MISHAGTGTDPEDGALPASGFTWRVDFHHDTHLHPLIPLTSGARSGSFTIPTTGETSANVWYRVHLTVTDSQGLLHSAFRDVRPRTATLQIATDPAGLQITLDGQPQTAPVSVVSVAGVIRTLGTVSPQTVGDLTYRFTSWSDGGASTHTIATPQTDTTYIQFLAYTPTVTPPDAPILTLQLNQTAFQPGETMILTATLVPGSTAALVDAYVAVRLSDGRVLSLQADGSLVPGIVPLAAGLLPFSFTGDIFRWTFGGEEPVGPHTWFTALTEAGTPHVIGDVDADPFTFSP